MNVADVPQEGNTTLGGHSKGIYARGAEGHLELVASKGWEAEEIVTRQAVEVFEQLAAAARERVRAGQSSPLEYHMYRARMDLPLLAQVSGLWRWRVRRHLQPAGFARLSPTLRQRYAEALGLPPARLDEID
ncbi:hypothetical protein AGMMS49960_05410 [Betaproteobacteria bacterium]|nr:hypothetical protein AGMMS49960_05410 [Betaproteobacteria bacterium]GHU24809.1 hypothetical protein AGMMS50243_28370 [Betaproteobacteria bacterium]